MGCAMPASIEKFIKASCLSADTAAENGRCGSNIYEVNLTSMQEKYKKLPK